MKKYVCVFVTILLLCSCNKIELIEDNGPWNLKLEMECSSNFIPEVKYEFGEYGESGESGAYNTITANVSSSYWSKDVTIKNGEYIMLVGKIPYSKTGYVTVKIYKDGELLCSETATKNSTSELGQAICSAWFRTTTKH